MTAPLLHARCEPAPLAWQDDARVIEPTPSTLGTAQGHYAFHLRDGDTHVLARDPLGVHKRFFALDDEGGVDDDRLLARLLQRQPAERVFAVPSSGVLRVSRGAITIDDRPPLEVTQHHEGPLDEAITSNVARIERALTQVFDRLEGSLAGREVWVTLSGGLDSSTVAALAVERFPSLRAITFRLDDGPLTDDEDLAAARRVAAHLGIPLFEAVVPPAQVLALVDEALVHGQDWRDFNVHCALVNAAIAQALGRATERPVVLTGTARTSSSRTTRPSSSKVASTTSSRGSPVGVFVASWSVGSTRGIARSGPSHVTVRRWCSPTCSLRARTPRCPTRSSRIVPRNSASRSGWSARVCRASCSSDRKCAPSARAKDDRAARSPCCTRRGSTRRVCSRASRSSSRWPRRGRASSSAAASIEPRDRLR